MAIISEHQRIGNGHTSFPVSRPVSRKAFRRDMPRRMGSVEALVNQVATKRPSIVQLIGREGWSQTSGFEFDLHRTLLIAFGDNRGTTVSKVGEERSGVRC